MTNLIVTPDLSRSPCQPHATSPAGQAEALGRRWTPGGARGDERNDDGFTPVRRSAEHGFTLVELMVVIVIIGLLAAIVAINVFPSGDKARAVRAKADISTIEAALDMYKLQNGSYPTTQQGLQALISAPTGANTATYQAGGYLKGHNVPVDPWNHPYLYSSPGQHGEADVWTLGRDAKDGGEGPDADIGSWQT